MGKLVSVECARCHKTFRTSHEHTLCTACRKAVAYSRKTKDATCSVCGAPCKLGLNDNSVPLCGLCRQHYSHNQKRRFGERMKKVCPKCGETFSTYEYGRATCPACARKRPYHEDNMTPEGRVKAGVKKLLLERAPRVWYCMPVAGAYGRSGIPDFLVSVNGHFVGIETKARDNKPTALQKVTMKSIEASGGKTLVINEDNLNSLGDWLDALLD